MIEIFLQDLDLISHPPMVHLIIKNKTYFISSSTGSLLNNAFDIKDLRTQDIFKLLLKFNYLKYHCFNN